MIRAVVKFLAGLVVTLVVVIFIGRFASPLPEVENRHDRGALLPTTQGPLADALARQEESHARQTGVAP